LASPIADKLKLIEPDNRQLSIVTQCALLQLNRSVFYYERKPLVSPEDIYLMGKMDKIYTDFPYYGSPRITHELQRKGIVINHKRVERLMRIMGIEAVYPKPNLSKNDKPHPVYPYLLKNLDITKSNQVWGTDITYIKVKNDWLYLVAILDWYSRYVISWELSDTLEAGFCVNNLQNALNQVIPDIHNSDQGSQFTSDDYLGTLQSQPTIQISMDGRGRCMDNIFTERLWRSVKYEEVYIQDYQSPREARQLLAKYLKTYNEKRLHQSLQYNTPAEIYFGTTTLKIKTKKEETIS
jgi:putative transposase